MLSQQPSAAPTERQPTARQPADGTSTVRQRRPGELLEQRARKAAAAMQVRRTDGTSAKSTKKRESKALNVSAVIDRLVDELVEMEL